MELKDLPVPKVGPGEVLVHMRTCGVCGTDLEKVHGEHITPPVLGHEVAGDIEQVGEQVHALKKGDRVVAHHHISCGSCFYCKNGLETLCEAYPKSNLDPCGFAEYFRLPEVLVEGGTVYKIPESMSYEDGSHVEPTACSIRALKKADVRAGSSVAVFGVGPAGLTHLQLAKAYGAAPIFAVDIIPNRLEFATKVGADLSLDPTRSNVPETLFSKTNGLGVDCAVVATGNMKAFDQAVDSVRKGGLVVMFGAPARGAQVQLDMSRLFLRELRFQSSYSTSETEMRMAMDMIGKKRINPSKLITHRFALAATLEAFRIAETASDAVKVMVENN